MITPRIQGLVDHIVSHINNLGLFPGYMAQGFYDYEEAKTYAEKLNEYLREHREFNWPDTIEATVIGKDKFFIWLTVTPHPVSEVIDIFAGPRA